MRYNFLESEKCFYKNEDICDLLINFVLILFWKKDFIEDILDSYMIL